MNAKPLVIALALGLGLDIASADTLTGKVRDAKGRPVAGARVDVATAAPKVGPAMFCPSCYLDCAKWTNTDADGKFAIAKLDPGLKFRLLTTATDMLSAMTPLVDPASENPAITLEPIPADLPPERTLNGRVVDVTGRPIAGALISPEGAETREKRWWGVVEGVRPAVSDSDGRFLLVLDRLYKGVDLEVMSSGFAGTSVPLLAPGSKSHAITVPLGGRVIGRLLDACKPVAGVQVAVVQLDRNAGGHFIKAVGATTDGAGKFVLENLPASQKYAIFSNVSSNSPTSPVLTTRTFMAPADGDSRNLGILPALHPMALSGRVFMPEGTKVPPRDPRNARPRTRLGPHRRPRRRGRHLLRSPPPARVLRNQRRRQGLRGRSRGPEIPNPRRDVVRRADERVDHEPVHPHEALRADPRPRRGLRHRG